tara:strand:+ start:286 stop:2703 length:2418 start_codon:yes stop_codon:yes gene_type:complete
MADTFYKPSLYLSNIFDEQIRADNELFEQFIKGYYEWVQTQKLTLTDAGTFSREERITGGTTGATAIVKQIGTGFIVVRVETTTPFSVNETITGGTSTSTAKISSIDDNVIRKSGQLLNYRSPEATVDNYERYLKDELYPSLPSTVLAEKELATPLFREFFQSKSNEESYKFLFRLLYGETISLRFPGEDLLRISDGNFDKPQILRAVNSSDVFKFVNKTIRGTSSGAIATVTEVVVITIGTTEVAEMSLKLVSGTFSAGETIVDLSDSTLTATLYGMVVSTTINDAGSGYEVGDALTITGDGSDAAATVSSIQNAPINSISVNTEGQGYRLHTDATINNTGTGGTNFAVRVTDISNTWVVTDGVTNYTVGTTTEVGVRNRGSGYFKNPTITLIDTTIQSIGLLHENLCTILSGGTNYGVGNTLTFTGGAGTGAAGQVASVTESTSFDFLFEDGDRMIQDGTYFDIIKNEDWNVLGAISRIELTNFGSGYETANLPSITITTSTGSSGVITANNIQGVGANVTVDSTNNSIGIGSIRGISFSDFGVNYTTANANLSSIGDGNANVTLSVAGSGTKDGIFLTDDGKISNKIIQDSLFHQDFSYVIRSGLTLNVYKEVLKKSIHPAGLEVFGEILLESLINVTPDFAAEITPIIANAGQYVLTVQHEFSASLQRSQIVEVEKDLPEANAFMFIDWIQSTSETWGDRLLSAYANVTIATYSSVTFGTTLAVANIVRQQPISGTITSDANTANLIGSGTSFTTDFNVGEFIVISNEKLKVLSIANNQHIGINIPTSLLYTNAVARKELI